MCNTVSHALFVLFITLVCVYSAEDPATVTKKVWFDITIGGQKAGRVVIGLFGNTVPKTVENFVTIASGTSDVSYKGTFFHRVIKDFMVQGGDVHNRDGHGGTSIWGRYFDDENFTLNHYGSGWLSMANAGTDTNGSQFFITLIPCPWLDGKHVILGKVLDGMSVIRAIGNVETEESDKPTKAVKVVDVGVDDVAHPFVVAREGVDGGPNN